MPPALDDSLRCDLLSQLERVRQWADAQAGVLPQPVLGRLQQAQRLLRESAPDLPRLAMIGHALMAWHLDQGFAQVPVHQAVAALAERLTELQAGR